MKFTEILEELKKVKKQHEKSGRRIKQNAINIFNLSTANV